MKNLIFLLLILPLSAQIPLPRPGVITNFSGHGAPGMVSTSKFGDHYVDVDSGTEYTCVAVGGRCGTVSSTSWKVAASGSSSSAGSVNAVQTSDGSGGFTDSGCTATGGVGTCANGFVAGTSFKASGAEIAAPTVSTPTLYFDSTLHLPVYLNASGIRSGVAIVPLADPGTDHNWVKFIPNTGTPTRTRPACADLSDAGTGCAGSAPTTNQNIREVVVAFSGNGSALTGTATACRYVDYGGTIQAATLTSNISGSVTVDVKTVVYSSWTGAASASSIAAAAIPALSSATKYQDTTLTGWTTSLSAGTMFCGVMSSPTTLTDATLVLKIAAN